MCLTCLKGYFWALKITATAGTETNTHLRSKNRFGVRFKQAEEGPASVRRTFAVLPHGLGAERKIAVWCSPDEEKEANERGFDWVKRL